MDPPWDWVAETRCTRWVPPSNLNTEYAPSPFTVNVYLPSKNSIGRPAIRGSPRTGEHPVEVSRPQARLLAAGAALYFDDHALLVVGRADHREAYLLLELLDPAARRLEILAQFGVLPHLREQFLGSCGVVLRAAPLRASFAAGSI